MAHSHAHSHRHGPVRVPLARGPIAVLLGFLVLSAIATVIGVVALWPDGAKVDALRDKAQFSAPGVTFLEATVRSVSTTCPEPDATEEVPSTPGDQPSCGTVV